MTVRRTLSLWCALALLIAAGVWLAVRSSLPPQADSISENGPVGVASPERMPVAKPEEAPPALPPGSEGGRDVADSVLSSTDPGDVTLDEWLRDQVDELPRTTLTGRVVDDEGKPVEARILVSTKLTLPGALLDAPVNQARILTDKSGTDGRFRLPGVETGSIRIAVRHAGFAPLDAREVSVPPGPSFDVGELRLQRGVIFSGRVLDSDLRPVPGASISLVSAPLFGPVHRLSPLTQSSLGASDEFGQFLLPCLPSGMSTLLVSHSGFPDASFEVEGRSGEARVDDLQFVLQRGSSITGSLLEFDERATPGLEVVARPIENLRLFQSSRPEGASGEWLAGSKAADVDPYGRFCIDGLDPLGTYQVQARRKSNVASVADEETADRWAPPTLAQAGASGVEVCYQPGCRIDFEVVDRVGGRKLEHLNIRLSGMSPPQPLDEQGKPRTNFPGGVVSMLDVRAIGAAPAYQAGEPREDQVEVVLTIEAPGHDTRVLSGLRLDPGALLDLGPVRLDSLAMLEVRVLDIATHSPVAGARVLMSADPPPPLDRRTSSVTLTRANGLARLTSLPTSACTLSVTAEGYAPMSLPAPSSVSDGDQPLEVLIARSAVVTVSVRDARGSKLAGSEVKLWREPGTGLPAWSRLQVTDVSGMSVFSDIPEGALLVQARSRLGFTRERLASPAAAAARTLVVKSGDSIAIELEVAALSTLSGTVWRGREPLASATISFSAERWGFHDLATDLEQFARAPHVVTDSHGEFRDVELAPGDYSLLIVQRDDAVRTRRWVHVDRTPTNLIIDVEDTQITGRVIDSSSQPLGNALVQLFADRPGRRTDIRPSLGDFLVPADAWRRPIAETTTDASGAYCLSCVPPGVPLEMFFSFGRRVASIPRINAPQGRILENIDAALPDAGSLEVILVAPLAPPGLHYGVRIAARKHPEGLAVQGAVFDSANRAHFDDLSPGEWVVMVFELDTAEQVVDRRTPQIIQVISNQTTEFSVGW